jgi:thiamine pyrophosphokinase
MRLFPGGERKNRGYPCEQLLILLTICIFSLCCIQYDLVILGGLAGRLDQTIHTLSYLHKLRKIRRRVFAVTDDNVGWVLSEVCIFYVKHLMDKLLGGAVIHIAATGV